MVNTTEEASSSRPKRQRLLSGVEDKVDEGENSGRDTVARPGTLNNVDLLQCSICCNPLSLRIFQCENGHISCSDCCIKMSNKCPFCISPTSNNRCKKMERVQEPIVFPCSNAKHGCAEKFSYGEELKHEKICSFALCYCPIETCNYSGVYKDLYNHYYANHRIRNPWKNVKRNQYITTKMLQISEKIHVIQEDKDGPLVVVQCFKEEEGSFVTVNLIAPLAAEAKELYHYDRYDLSYSLEGNTMTYRSDKINNILKVSFQTPEKEFLFVPHYFLDKCPKLKMHLCIHKLIESEEEEEEEEEEADEEE